MFDNSKHREMETLTENQLNERHSVGSIISGSPKVVHTTTQ